MQGRGDGNDWVTSVKISYSLNGKDWKFVENGKVFKANSDRNTHKLIPFDEPLKARVVRIYPWTWNGHICFRFDAVYFDVSDLNCRI